MSDIEEIKKQIRELSAAEFAQVRDWILDSDAWDRQIETDAHCGKLDKLIAEARAAFRSGQTREL